MIVDQLAELELHCDELHESSRREQNLIHELKVSSREHELSEASLRDRLEALEAEERRTNWKLVASTQRSEEMEEMIQRLQGRERSLMEELEAEKMRTEELDGSMRKLKERERLLSEQLDVGKNRAEEMDGIIRKQRDRERTLSDQMDVGSTRAEEMDGVIRKLRQREWSLTQQVDAARATAEETDALVQKLKERERQLMDQVEAYQKKEYDLKMKLDKATMDAHERDRTIRKLESEFVDERNAWLKKIDELRTSINDKEESEFSLKQDKRSLQDHELTLQMKLDGETSALATTTSKKAELERTNDHLSGRLHELQEEHSKLLFTLANLKSERDKLINELDEANVKAATVQEDLGGSLQKNARMEAWLYEVQANHENSERTWAMRLGELKASEKRHQQRTAELESQVNTVLIR